MAKITLRFISIVHISKTSNVNADSLVFFGIMFAKFRFNKTGSLTKENTKRHYFKNKEARKEIL